MADTADFLATETAEAQRMLTQFRVHELKELLKSLNCSTRGRKQELYVRSANLLEHGSPKIYKRIKEIHEKYLFLGRRSYVRSPIKGANFPKGNHSSLPPPPPPSFINYPNVVFKPHPFYEKIDTIVRPTSLVNNRSAYGNRCNMDLQFYLTEQQVKLVSSSRTPLGTFQTQVILRLCRHEVSCEQEDYYPQQCDLFVNRQSCVIPGYHPLMSTRPEYKRNGKPINITPHVKMSWTDMNTLTVIWASESQMFAQGYCVCIDLVHCLSATDLLQILKAKGMRSPDVSRALVREKLSVDRDSEISATCLKLSMICPLGKMKMKYPCRGISCNHLQCFDAATYLQMNERKAKWICPVCDRPALFNDLVIDGLLIEICEQSSETDIEFSSDGKWHPIKLSDKKTLSVSVPQKSTVTISDSPSPNSQGEADHVVIDLTEDSDTEEASNGMGELINVTSDEVDDAGALPALVDVNVTRGDDSFPDSPPSLRVGSRIPVISMRPRTPNILTTDNAETLQNIASVSPSHNHPSGANKAMRYPYSNWPTSSGYFPFSSLSFSRPNSS